MQSIGILSGSYLSLYVNEHIYSGSKVDVNRFRAPSHQNIWIHYIVLFSSVDLLLEHYGVTADASLVPALNCPKLPKVSITPLKIFSSLSSYTILGNVWCWH